MKLFITILFAVSCMSLTGYSQSGQYDLVINNGRVMDPETMYDDIANVGIKDGRIAVITKNKISGKETIDAKGLVVAPGFIDTHYHAVDEFATKMALRDGVTTGMDLEAGAFNVKKWYDNKAKTGWQVNYGTVTGLSFVRMSVHDPEAGVRDAVVDFSNQGPFTAAAASDGTVGWSLTKSSIEQMNQILGIMDEDLRQGALGIGVSLAYMARGVQSYEMFSAQRVAANYGRLTSVHMRYHLQKDLPNEATISFDEIFSNAMLTDAPLLVAHNNDYGWWEIEEKLQLARGKGLNMWSEYYPYYGGSTFVSADFLRPDNWVDNFGYKYEETIYDPVDDKMLTNDTYAALVKKEPGRSVVVYMLYRKPWLPMWLTVPHMTLASDAMAGVGPDGKLLPWDADWSEYRGHPRTSGTRGASFRMAREQGVPLMFTISQASYWVAKHLGETGLKSMQERGRIQVGKVADITIFNPEKITDNSTFKVGEHGIPSTGIPYVIVNGVIVVKNSEVLPVKPGQAIRFPVEDKGRFEPIDKGVWIDKTTIAPNPDFHIDDTGAGVINKGKH